MDSNEIISPKMAEKLRVFAQDLTNMGKQLQCSICLSLMDNPYMAKCKHAFCKNCLHGYISSTGVKGICKCPLCKERCLRRETGKYTRLEEIVSAFKDLLPLSRTGALTEDEDPSCATQVPPMSQVLDGLEANVRIADLLKDEDSTNQDPIEAEVQTDKGNKQKQPGRSSLSNSNSHTPGFQNRFSFLDDDEIGLSSAIGNVNSNNPITPLTVPGKKRFQNRQHDCSTTTPAKIPTATTVKEDQCFAKTPCLKSISNTPGTAKTVLVDDQMKNQIQTPCPSTLGTTPGTDKTVVVGNDPLRNTFACPDKVTITPRVTKPTVLEKLKASNSIESPYVNTLSMTPATEKTQQVHSARRGSLDSLINNTQGTLLVGRDSLDTSISRKSLINSTQGTLVVRKDSIGTNTSILSACDANNREEKQIVDKANEKQEESDISEVGIMIASSENDALDMKGNKESLVPKTKEMPVEDSKNEHKQWQVEKNNKNENLELLNTSKVEKTNLDNKHNADTRDFENKNALVCDVNETEREKCIQPKAKTKQNMITKPQDDTKSDKQHLAPGTKDIPAADTNKVQKQSQERGNIENEGFELQPKSEAEKGSFNNKYSAESKFPACDLNDTERKGNTKPEAKTKQSTDQTDNESKDETTNEYATKPGSIDPDKNSPCKNLIIDETTKAQAEPSTTRQKLEENVEMSKSSIATEKLNADALEVIVKGITVTVKPHCNPKNKKYSEGGTGVVTQVHQDGTYDIRYVLGGSGKRIERDKIVIGIGIDERVKRGRNIKQEAVVGRKQSRLRTRDIPPHMSRRKGKQIKKTIQDGENKTTQVTTGTDHGDSHKMQRTQMPSSRENKETKTGAASITVSRDGQSSCETTTPLKNHSLEIKKDLHISTIDTGKQKGKVTKILSNDSKTVAELKTKKAEGNIRKTRPALTENNGKVCDTIEQKTEDKSEFEMLLPVANTKQYSDTDTELSTVVPNSNSEVTNSYNATDCSISNSNETNSVPCSASTVSATEDSKSQKEDPSSNYIPFVETAEQKDTSEFGSMKLELWDQVTVERRMMPGMNKPGGVGRIMRVHEDNTFDVKYIVGGSEKNIPVKYITKGINVESDSVCGKSRGSRRRRLNRSANRQAEKEGNDPKIPHIKHPLNVPAGKRKHPKDVSRSDGENKAKVSKQSRNMSKLTTNKVSTTKVGKRKKQSNSIVRPGKRSRNTNAHSNDSEKYQNQVQAGCASVDQNISPEENTSSLQEVGCPKKLLSSKTKNLGLENDVGQINLSPSSNMSAKKPVIAVSGVSGEVLKQVNKAVLRLGGKVFSGNLKPENFSTVTHIITESASKKKDAHLLIKNRTMKVFFGLAYGVWIVAPSWIEKSVTEGNWVDEVQHEMEGDAKLASLGLGGPHRARLAVLSKSNGRTGSSPSLLFSGINILFCGAFKEGAGCPKKGDLIALVKLCGAKVVRSVKLLRSCINEMQEQVITASVSVLAEESLMTDPSSDCIVVCQNRENFEKAKSYKQISDLHHERMISVVHPSWILDSLTLYYKQETKAYPL